MNTRWPNGERTNSANSSAAQKPITWLKFCKKTLNPHNLRHLKMYFKAYVYQMLLRNVNIKQYVKSNLKTSIRISSQTPYKSCYLLGRLNWGETLVDMAKRCCTQNAGCPVYSSLHWKFQKCAPLVFWSPSVGTLLQDKICHYLAVFHLTYKLTGRYSCEKLFVNYKYEKHLQTRSK